jgi:hypothetical protein
MAEYLFLMHDDGTPDDSAWEPYLRGLRQRGCFDGGSEIGDGICVRKDGVSPTLTPRLAGYIRVRAGSFDEAKSLLAGNPVFEAGGTVEIRELPPSR